MQPPGVPFTAPFSLGLPPALLINMSLWKKKLRKNLYFSNSGFCFKLQTQAWLYCTATKRPPQARNTLWEAIYKV